RPQLACTLGSAIWFRTVLLVPFRLLGSRRGSAARSSIAQGRTAPRTPGATTRSGAASRDKRRFATRTAVGCSSQPAIAASERCFAALARCALIVLGSRGGRRDSLAGAERGVVETRRDSRETQERG